jgi:thioredoxin
MVKKIASQAELEREFRAAGDKAVIIDFYASWCEPCKTIAPRISELESKYPGVVVLKVDVDKLETLADRYKINCMPTFKVFIRGQEVKGDTVASASLPRVESLFKKYK